MVPESVGIICPSHKEVKKKTKLVLYIARLRILQIVLPGPVLSQAEEDSFWLTLLDLFGLEDNTLGGNSLDVKITFQLFAYLNEQWGYLQ